MQAMGWVTAGVFLMMGAGVLIANARPHAQERAMVKFALNVGLPLPEHLAEPIRRRMLSRRRSSTIGAMIGAATSVILFLMTPASNPDGVLSPLIVVAGIFAGWAIGISVSAFRTTGQTSDDRVRYARARAVDLDDYISRAELWLARIPIALAVVAFAAVATLAQLGLVHYNGTAALVGPVALALVAVCTLIASEMVGRRVVAMGNDVESPEDLVWEDAVRATTIRELAAAPTFLGYYCLLMAFNPLVVSPDDGARPAFAIASLGVAIITLVIAIGMLVSVLAVKRHFLRRLWPELASEVSA